LGTVESIKENVTRLYNWTDVSLSHSGEDMLNPPLDTRPIQLLVQPEERDPRRAIVIAQYVGSQYVPNCDVAFEKVVAWRELPLSAEGQLRRLSSLPSSSRIS